MAAVAQKSLAVNDPQQTLMMAKAATIVSGQYIDYLLHKSPLL